MKNVHLIATDKPSRLIGNVKGFCQTTENFTQNDLDFISAKFYNIYITDNSEIKKRDWIVIKNIELNRVSTIKCETENQVLIANSKSDYNIKKKIILTTDQDLIADGIQSIDDEFLEWFCKNSSCEFVEVERLEDGQYVDRFADGSVVEGIYENYKIIIQNEESKPHTFCETPNEKCTMNYCDENGCQNRNRELVEPKEESNIIDQWLEKNDNSEIDKQVEEAAKNHWKMQYIMALDESTKPYIIQDFIAGAKWQQEQDKNKYSEEEVKNLLIECCGEISCEDGILVGKFPEELAEWIDKKLEERRDTFIKSVCKNCNQPIEMHSTSSKMCFDRLTHYE